MWNRWKDMNRHAQDRVSSLTKELFEDAQAFAREFGKEFPLPLHQYSAVVAWQPVTLARDLPCHYSRKVMKKGTQAMLGLFELLPPVFVSFDSWKKITTEKKGGGKKKKE